MEIYLKLEERRAGVRSSGCDHWDLELCAEALSCSIKFALMSAVKVCQAGFPCSSRAGSGLLPCDRSVLQGLLSASLECNRSAQEVTAVLVSCQARCPVLLCSAAVRAFSWFPRPLFDRFLRNLAHNTVISLMMLLQISMSAAFL